MKRSLLAYSTSAAFHAHFDSLNQHSNSIAIHCVSAIQTFFECISHQPYDAVLIDASNRDLPLSLITVDLLEQNPDIKILLLSPDDGFADEELDEVIYHAVLSNPINNAEIEASLLLFFPAPNTRPEETTVPAETIAAPESQPPEVNERSLIEIIDAAVFGLEPAEEPMALITNSDTPQTGNNSQQPISAAETLAQPDFSTLHFDYCCVLIPQKPQYYLTRSLAACIAAALPLTHQARGWRVTAISVRPQYLQWIVALPAETCPVEAICEIRQATSSYLFEQFPELKGKDDQTDFWAPGYLMLSGCNPISMRFIHQFIDRASLTVSTTVIPE